MPILQRTRPARALADALQDRGRSLRLGRVPRLPRRRRGHQPDVGHLRRGITALRSWHTPLAAAPTGALDASALHAWVVKGGEVAGQLDVGQRGQEQREHTRNHKGASAEHPAIGSSLALPRDGQGDVRDTVCPRLMSIAVLD